MVKRLLLATVFLCLSACDTVHEEFTLISTVSFDKTKFNVSAEKHKCDNKPFPYQSRRLASSALEAAITESLVAEGGDMLLDAHLTDARNLVTGFIQSAKYYRGKGMYRMYIINKAYSVKMYGKAKPAKSIDQLSRTSNAAYSNTLHTTQKSNSSAQNLCQIRGALNSARDVVEEGQELYNKSSNLFKDIKSTLSR